MWYKNCLSFQLSAAQLLKKTISIKKKKCNLSWFLNFWMLKDSKDSTLSQMFNLCTTQWLKKIFWWNRLKCIQTKNLIECSYFWRKFRLRTNFIKNHQVGFFLFIYIFFFSVFVGVLNQLKCVKIFLKKIFSINFDHKTLLLRYKWLPGVEFKLAILFLYFCLFFDFD